MDIAITPAAADKIATLLAQEAQEAGQAESAQDLFLRVSVQAGGCSGFQYTFTFDATMTDDDIEFAQGQARVVVDVISLGYLKGAQIDYKQELIGSALVITGNPNATSSCGCGSSFSIF